ncbi:MAG: alternative ribosome rescue aminoacyl-tRNA hydrolase ArfB [Bacteroidota bacterium]
MMSKLEDRIRSGEFYKELKFQTARSGGAGGQHVNKVETKVQLFFDISNSRLLDDLEKQRLMEKLQNRIDQEGVLSIQSQEKRSQNQNKEIAVKKFYDLMRSAFRRKKVRKATKPSKSAIEKRLKEKKARSEKKSNRGWSMD